ncbi:hypothetical protein EMEDMD4_570060 [Sinorhizobium medicae]|uniref:Uncharacterized protein n=1 Tax=Sinorhizobium medicae TaxID=110321 RepID=A0A508X7Z5_9HYPH|nr:hypothetical protein EMEDMD4_570060 [Sinorhizobium medicae]
MRIERALNRESERLKLLKSLSYALENLKVFRSRRRNRRLANMRVKTHNPYACDGDPSGEAHGLDQAA